MRPGNSMQANSRPTPCPCTPSDGIRRETTRIMPEAPARSSQLWAKRSSTARKREDRSIAMPPTAPQSTGPRCSSWGREVSSMHRPEEHLAGNRGLGAATYRRYPEHRGSALGIDVKRRIIHPKVSSPSTNRCSAYPHERSPGRVNRPFLACPELKSSKRTRGGNSPKLTRKAPRGLRSRYRSHNVHWRRSLANKFPKHIIEQPLFTVACILCHRCGRGGSRAGAAKGTTTLRLHASVGIALPRMPVPPPARVKTG